jgi:thiamine-phosphate pyrophosphorylase
VCALNNPRNARERRKLCYVTDRQSLAGGNASSIGALLRKIEEVLSARVDWVQIRERDLAGKEVAGLVQEALHKAAELPNGPSTTRILINDRVDVAIAGRAGGVHLAENSLHVGDVKELLRRVGAVSVRDNFLVGVSCHSWEAAEVASGSGADYIFFGPVFATPSKAAFGAPQGLQRLEHVCRTLSVPVIAIGGVSLENAASCISAGASGIAAIRLFQDAPDVKSQVALLRDLGF